MPTPHNIDTQIWEYIDGSGTAAERSNIQQLISNNQEWRRKYEELLQVNATLKDNIDIDAPSMRFTVNVMEEISRFHIAPSATSYINKKIIYGIAGFFLTLILGFLIYAIAQIDWSVGSTTSNLPFDMRKIDTSRILSNNYVNAFMIINSVLGLMLLDRYLAHQRKSWKKDNA